MSKITQYPQAMSFDEGDFLLKDGVNGTKIISVDDVVDEFSEKSWLSNEIDDLKSALETYEDRTSDGKTGFVLIANSYITTQGVITPYNNWARTDYLHCNGYRKLTVYNGSGSNSQYNAFYKQDLTFISKFTCGANEARTFDIPTDAAFFICSNNKNAMNTYTFRLSDSRVYDDISLINNKIDSIDTSIDEISEIVNPTNWFHDFELGAYYNTSGTIVESNDFGMTGYIPIKQNDTVMRWKDGVYQAITQINEFDSMKNFVRRVTPSGGYPFTITDSDISYISLTLAASTMGGEQIVGINVSEAPVYSEYFEPHKTAKVETDTTLSKSGIAADAKTVGDRLVALGNNESLITYDGTIFTIAGNNHKLYITHQVDNTIRQDTWRVNRGSIINNGAETDMWNGSDADGVLRMANEDDFVGGYHGDELTQSVTVYIDGETVNLSNPISAKNFRSFLMFVESDVYHCIDNADSAQIAFKRNKIISYQNGELKISNHWTAQKSVSMTIAYVGMLSVQRSLISGYTLNNNYKLTDKNTATPAVDYGRFGSMILTTGDILDYKVENGSDRAPKGSAISYSGSGVSDRIKFYFATLSKTNDDPITLNANDVIYGQSILKFSR